MDFHAYNTNISQDAMAKIEIYLNWVAVNEYQDFQEDTMATLEVLAILVLLLEADHAQERGLLARALGAAQASDALGAARQLRGALGAGAAADAP